MSFARYAAAFLGAAFFAHAANAQPLQDVTVGLGSRSIPGGALRVAKELGLFEKHGLNASFVFTDSPTIAISGLLAGSFKFSVTGFPDFLTARAKAQDVVVIASTYDGLGVNTVIEKGTAAKLGVARNAPIEHRLKALDGLLIAATGPSSTTRISLDVAAKSVGANIRFTYMTYQAMLAAIGAGAIQGYTAAAPFWAQSVTSGKAVDWISIKDELPAKFVPTMSSALGTKGDVIKNEPELVRKMAAVVADLGVAVKERPADVRAAMAKLFDGLDAKTMDVLFEGETRSWQTKPLTVEQVQREIDYLKSAALAPPELDKVSPASMIYRP